MATDFVQCHWQTQNRFSPGIRTLTNGIPVLMQTWCISGDCLLFDVRMCGLQYMDRNYD